MLKYNSFRSDRYLRSKFVEGRYLLASELGDVELELLDTLRRQVKQTVGNVAINDAWKVTYLSPNSLLISPGEAWFEGLPFNFRYGKDNLVSTSGGLITPGFLPPGVQITDEPNGLGKILTFSASPTDTYRVIITAHEQVITNIDDPFLKNLNVPEATGQKIRLIYKINVVSSSLQKDNSLSNLFSPSYTGTAAQNLSNKIQINPTTGNGTLVSSTPVTGSQTVIDGRKVDITINNPVGFQQFPYTAADQTEYKNGTLIDTLGNEYHISLVRNDVVAGRVILSLDSEVGQPIIPVIPSDPGGGNPYFIIKQDVYYTDDTQGTPLGNLNWPVAQIVWNNSNQFVHPSVITDLRERILSDEAYENVINQKFEITLNGGGIIWVDIDGQTLNWNTNFTLVNPSGPSQIINTGSAAIIDGGSLVYNMNLTSGGVISKGPLAVTISSNSGSTTSFSGGPDLTLVSIGNIIVAGNQTSQITAIDNVNKTVTVSPAITNTGSATIYRDSYAPGTAPLKETNFTLATRVGSIIKLMSNLELSAGESNALYDVRIQYPSGLAANTNITLPNNTLTGNPQYYNASKRNLLVTQNQLVKFQGVDWLPVDPQTIQFTYALPNDSEVHFRIESLPAGSVGGGGGSGGGTLQAAYNAGNSIVTAGGLPVVFGGSASKVAQFNGDIGVTGVIDPAGLQLTPQASDPLSGQKGIWVNTSNQLMFEGASSLNVSQSISDLQSGTTNPITVGPGLSKTGNEIDVIYAPANKLVVTAGESFAANTTYLVRWALNGEAVGRVYKANSSTASNKQFYVVGLLLSSISLNAGDSTTITVVGDHTLGSSDTIFNGVDIGKPVYLTNNGSGSYTLVPPTSVGDAQFKVGMVKSTTEIWVDLKELEIIVPQPVYDERLLFPSGLVALTTITLPNNSRNSNLPQTYDALAGDLKVFQNQLYKVQGTDWISSGNNSIQFNYDLPNDAEIHFRIDPPSSGIFNIGGGGGGGGGTLQDAYNAGNTINVISGVPVIINGPAAQKLLQINGDITVTGVIDPSAIQLTQQGSNPLAPGQHGLWIDNSGNLMQQAGASSTNITTVINNVIAGTAQTSISLTYTNNTGSPIAGLIPVYSPSAGTIAPADGTDINKFRVIGITTESIANGSSGNVALSGVVSGISGFTHNSYLYLGLTPGSLTDVGPSAGSYPQGFEIIRLGVIEGTNLLLQIQHMGVL